jgi:hypothetical protein
MATGGFIGVPKGWPCRAVGSAAPMALRSTRCNCYSWPMGTQGCWRVSAVLGRRGGIVALPRLASVASLLAILPIVAGCSASPPWASSNPPPGGQAAVPPPPNYSTAAAGQPAYAPPPGQPGYAPPPGQPGYAPPPGQQAYAPPPQAPQQDPGTIGSVRQSYTGFLSMFRDPPSQDPNAQPGYDGRASAYPQQSLADLFRGSDPAQSPSPSGAGYQQQQPGSAAPTQRAYVPHPPSTYTASQQPYAPPGQPASSPPPQQNYAAPPPQQNYAPPPQQNYAPQTQSGYAPRSGQQSYAAPPPAYGAAAGGATAAAAPAARPDYSDSLPYPKQSLVDAFRGSTDSQNPSVPHPPSSYSASGQPYSPQGQQANSAPPPPADPTDSLPYPKQTLFGN